MSPVAMTLDVDLLKRAKAIIELTGKQGDTSVTRAISIELYAECKRLKAALASIGKNTCGREPLAAAYARGILSESPEPVSFGIGKESP